MDSVKLLLPTKIGGTNVMFSGRHSSPLPRLQPPKQDGRIGLKYYIPTYAIDVLKWADGWLPEGGGEGGKETRELIQ